MVAEAVFLQVEHALDEVPVDEQLADGLFLVVPDTSRVAGDGAGIEHDGGAPGGIEAGLGCLEAT